MIKRSKLWASISTATLASAVGIGVTGCDPAENDKAETPQASEISVAESAISVQSYGEGEGEGEGEGAVDLASDDLAYLTQLALMRGHVFVGNELYKAGHIEHANTHMKHPKSELYTGMVPAFVARSANGFEKELEALSTSVANQQSNDIVVTAYESLTKAIAENEKAVDAASLSPKQRLKLVSEIMRVAGEEYAIAVVDGEMQNAHEYQDALGFTTIATSILESVESADGDVVDIRKKALQHLEDLKGHWPSLIPPERLSTEASALYVAAAKIELLSLGL